MGQIIARELNPVNYNCPTCKKSGKLPNAAGRFFIVSLTECKCNGCNTVYPKSKFYKTFVPDVKHYRNSKKVTF